jgi:hypothetical protein
LLRRENGCAVGRFCAVAQRYALIDEPLYSHVVRGLMHLQLNGLDIDIFHFSWGAFGISDHDACILEVAFFGGGEGV